MARVARVGDAVDGFVSGDLVIPLDRENWVQRKVAKASRLIKVPAGVDPLQAAMLKVNPPTAWLMMTKYVDLAPGDWIVQTAANSGVGHCLVQLAKAEGFKTVNIVRREGLADELVTLGADAVLLDGPDLAQRITAATAGARIRLAIDRSAAPRSCGSAMRSPTRRWCSTMAGCPARTRSSAATSACSSGSC